jgi:hypothetical protein
MTLKTSVTFRNDNPNTIWNRLAARLGREPTNEEAKAEVLRILSEPKQEALFGEASA